MQSTRSVSTRRASTWCPSVWGRCSRPGRSCATPGSPKPWGSRSPTCSGWEACVRATRARASTRCSRRWSGFPAAARPWRWSAPSGLRPTGSPPTRGGGTCASCCAGRSTTPTSPRCTVRPRSWSCRRRTRASGLTALEAMASAAPLVATAVGNLPRLTLDVAVLVPPGDPEALAAAIESVLVRTGPRRSHAPRRGRPGVRIRVGPHRRAHRRGLPGGRASEQAQPHLTASLGFRRPRRPPGAGHRRAGSAR